MTEKMFTADPSGLRKLIQDCQECADDRYTTGTASEMLNEAVSALEMYLADIERAGKRSRRVAR